MDVPPLALVVGGEPQIKGLAERVLDLRQRHFSRARDGDVRGEADVGREARAALTTDSGLIPRKTTRGVALETKRLSIWMAELVHRPSTDPQSEGHAPDPAHSCFNLEREKALNLDASKRFSRILVRISNPIGHSAQRLDHRISRFVWCACR